MPVIADHERIREEIVYLEARLAEIGHDGDCAYEKAIVCFFNERLVQLRQRLECAGFVTSVQT